MGFKNRINEGVVYVFTGVCARACVRRAAVSNLKHLFCCFGRLHDGSAGLVSRAWREGDERWRQTERSRRTKDCVSFAFSYFLYPTLYNGIMINDLMGLCVLLLPFSRGCSWICHG